MSPPRKKPPNKTSKTTDAGYGAEAMEKNILPPVRLELTLLSESGLKPDAATNYATVVFCRTHNLFVVLNAPQLTQLTPTISARSLSSVTNLSTI